MPNIRTILLSSLILCISACASSLAEDYTKSDHFDGKKFKNHSPEYKEKSTMDFFKWVFNREKEGSWEYAPLANGPFEPPQRVDDGIRVTFINHASMLIQVDGLNVLTDPIWSKRCSPIPWLGPARYHDPGVRFEDLPPIDVVLLSHNHYDHFDGPTLKRLNKHHKPLFVAGLGNEALLKSKGIETANIVSLDWWQTKELDGNVKLHGTPAQHWSTRTRLDNNESLWMSYVLETSKGPIYFAGDTGFSEHFSEISKRFGAMNVALIPIGAYTPRWFMKDNHLSPDDALLAHEALGSKQSIAMHFGTFALGDDGQTQAADQLRERSAERNMPAGEFIIPTPGKSYEF